MANLERAVAVALATVLAGGCVTTVTMTSDTTPRPALAAVYGFVLAGLLAQVEARFEVRRSRLEETARTAGEVRRRAVEELLTASENDLQEALVEASRRGAAAAGTSSPASGSGAAGDPEATGNELAPLADWITVRFGELRSELRRGSRSAATGGGAREAATAPASAAGTQRLAALRPVAASAGEARRAALPPAAAGSILDDVLALIRRLRRQAEEDRLTLDLCARTTPPGAQVTVFPASYPQGVHGGLSDHRFVRLYRGLYLYRIESADGAELSCLELPAPGHEPACAPLDLMDDDREVWSCVLPLGRGREAGCRRLDRSPEECTGDG